MAVLLLTVLPFVGLRLAAQDAPPVITSNPQTQTVNAGQNVTLNVQASGTAPLSFQWWFASLRLPGATNSSLVLDFVDALDSGSYLAVVTNAFGAVTSAPAVLTVIGPPIILEGPTNVTIYTGQSATFSVLAFSRTTNTYQWLYQGNTLPDATNRTLTLSNTTTNNSGFYSVQVSNNNGTTTTLPAELQVLPLPMPALRLGVVTVTNRIRVPVLYTAYGIETNVSLSAEWDPAQYGFAAFEPDLGALEPDPTLTRGSARVRSSSLPPSTEVTLDDSQLGEGRLGIRLNWNPGVFLPPGESTVGSLVFEPLQGIQSLYAGRLGLTNQPVAALVSPPVEGQTNILLSAIDPQVILASPFVLDRQTGYLQQTIEFANPGNRFATNARLTVSGLGFDRNTNGIALGNAQGYLLPDFLPYVDFGAIAPSEIRRGVLQYYVTDRLTRPDPLFTMYATPEVQFNPPSGNPLQATVRYTNDLVLVEFPTIPLFRYYIQYSSNPTNFASGTVQTSLPHVLGTGSNLQWLDSGPPRTQPTGEGEQRFYRVLEVE